MNATTLRKYASTAAVTICSRAAVGFQSSGRTNKVPRSDADRQRSGKIWLFFKIFGIWLGRTLASPLLASQRNAKKHTQRRATRITDDLGVSRDTVIALAHRQLYRVSSKLIRFDIAKVRRGIDESGDQLASSCLSGRFSTTQYVGMGSWLERRKGPCRPVSADMRSACARFRHRAGSGTRPSVACADCAERQIHRDKPEADRGSRRDRFRSAIAGGFQWRGPPKAAPFAPLRRSIRRG